MFVMSVLLVLFCSVVLGCRYTPKIIAYWSVQSVLFLIGGVLSVKLHIFGLWHYYVCCIRSGAFRCTLLWCLCRMCQCGLNAVLWSHIGILLRRLAAEHCISAGLLTLSQCPCGTILLSLYYMVCDWQVLRVGPMIFIGLSCALPFVFYVFLFLSTIGQYCGTGVFGLIGCKSLFPALHCRPLLLLLIIIIIIITCMIA